MAFTVERVVFAFALCLCMCPCESAKINTPRVLLPWFDNLNVNFTFEIIEGGCYTWSLSREDIIDLEPLYEDGCSRAARVTVSKRCVAPGTVIILAEEIHTGELLRGDVDVDKIHSLKVMSTTMKLYLEEAPEAFEVIAYDDKGNRFSSLDGVSFTWTIENVGSTAGEDNIVTLVRWRDTDYEAPRGITELEAVGLRAYIVLLYGQAMGDARGTVCLDDICTDFHLQVVASVVLTPATAYIAPGDTIRYKVVRMRAGRLTVQDVGDTLYNMIVPDTGLAYLEDKISLVRGTEVGSTTVTLMSGSTEVTTATLTIAEPHSIRVSLRPSKLLIRGEDFVIHCVVLDRDGHTLFAGQETLIRLSVNGEANVELLRSTENGTITDAVALDAGQFKVTAKLHSIAGKLLHKKVEGTVTGVAVDPLQIVPPELFVAWTDTIQEVPLKHIGGGNESVIWSVSEKATTNAISLTPAGVVSVRGEGELEVKVQLKNYPHVRAFGKVWSIPPELVQVSSSGHARVGRPHQLHIALTATHPVTGEYYNYHRCNCGSFAVSLLEGPEPHNVTSAQWVEPADGACCVLECVYTTRGVSTIRVSRGRAGDTTRVAVRAAPALLWPHAAAALVGATLPVLAEGEALVPQSSEPRIVELSGRDGPTPHRYPDIQLFTLKCRRKGDSRLELVSLADDERESADFEAACAPFVSRVRLEPSDTPGNCTGGPRVWLRPGHEVTVRVVLLDAIGRELLDERGPKATWDLEPHHPGIEYKSTDRLLVETHPDYAPVPVPYKYYQSVVADEQAVGWTGALKISIPEATASIQARVVGPLKCDPLKVNVAWEGETVNNVILVSGGSGRYAVDAPKGVSATVLDGALSVNVPGPGSYDLLITDLCVQGEKQFVEVHVEEILSVEVSTSRAVCVGGCVPITALVKGVSHRYLTTSHAPEWRVSGDVLVRDGTICGLKEGTGRVRASLGGVWSPEVEVLVFPPLRIIPDTARLPPGARLQLRHQGGPPAHLASLHYRAVAKHKYIEDTARYCHCNDTSSVPLRIIPDTARLPPGARLQLRHQGGPPSHLASLHYRAVAKHKYIEVSSSGAVHGLSTGTGRVRLVATDIAHVEMASAEAEVEVIPISGLRVRAATQSLLVGSPGPIWVEANGLPASALASLMPLPRLTWSVRDPTAARLYTTHADDSPQFRSALLLRSATGMILISSVPEPAVGSPGPIWVEANGLPASALASLMPLPRLTWSVRDPTAARLYTTHADDLLERSVAEGLSVRVVPLKPGVITIDVRVRNMGQAAETRSWDSTIEILGISDIRASVEGLPKELSSSERLAVAVGSTLRLKSLPRGNWNAYQDGAFEISANGELKALKPGHGVIVAQHKDERNNIYRETVIHVEVAIPHYCTAEPAGDADEVAVRLVMRNSLGRELIAPLANVTALAPTLAHVRRAADSALGNELLITHLEPAGAFAAFQGSAGGVTVKDEVWLAGNEAHPSRTLATGGWAICLEGVGWRAPPGVSLYAGSGVSLALLSRDHAAKHALRLDRPPLTATVQQIPFDKMEFMPGDWPSSMVPLTIEASLLTGGPLLCSEEQRYAVDGVEVDLPYACRTKAPHMAKPVLDIINGQLGCSIIPAAPITDASEVELCAEWGVARTCTKVLLLPQISVSHSKVSLLKPPTTFTVTGHPRALKLVKLTTSPGLKLDITHKDTEIFVVVKNEASTCGVGLVNVKSKLTAQEIQVEVERECDVTCGTLLGALFSILMPYLPSLMTVAAIAVAYMYIQARLQRKSPIRLPMEPVQTVLPAETTPTFNRSRTFSRSPFASNGPSSPVYGDASMLPPDSSFSPNSTRVHSRFL